MSKFEVVIEGTPIAKGRPRLGRFGAYTPAKTIRAEKAIAFEVRKTWKEQPLSTPLKVDIVFSFVHPKSHSKSEKLERRHSKRPDVDNLVKLTMDALNEVLWTDDALIWVLHITKVYGEAESTHIRVEWDDVA